LLRVDMTASQWYASDHRSLPLIRFEMDGKPLLPGEATELVLDQADSLSALDAAQDGCVGALVITQKKNALSAAPLLEVREIRRREVGVLCEVVVVGRVKIGRVEHSRHFTAHDIDVLQDEDTTTCDAELINQVQVAAALHESMRSKLEEVTGESAAPAKFTLKPPFLLSERMEPVDDRDKSFESAQQLPMDDAAVCMRDELCAVELDREPATSLSRLHSLWNVRGESEAELQLLSFAACQSLSSVQRCMALGMQSTEKRLQHARSCSLRATKKMAASLAIYEALAKVG